MRRRKKQPEIVLKDDPLQIVFFMVKHQFRIKQEKDWKSLEQQITYNAMIGSSAFDLTHFFLEGIDWSIKRGVNLFGFLTGASGKGKSSQPLLSCLK